MGLGKEERKMDGSARTMAKSVIDMRAVKR